MGPAGKVYAVDINRSVLVYVRYIAAHDKRVNVVAHHSVAENVGLPRASVDLAFVIQTYHAMIVFSDPGNAGVYKRRLLPWLRSIHAALKPGGRLVIQDGVEKIPAKVLRQQVEGAGFKTVSVGTGAPKAEDILAVFKKP